MARSSIMGLAFLDGAQAQKHVTVNEALARIDAVAARRVRSLALGVPPVAVEGEAYVVGPAPVGAWAGRAGQIALALAGGWEFFAPPPGWRVWVDDLGTEAVLAGGLWVPGVVAGAPGGAATLMAVREITHAVTAGATNTTVAAIPAKSVVLGVTGVVSVALTGATSWSLGVAGGADRYGSGYGAALGSRAEGLTGTPLTYYSDTPLLLTAVGGAFTGGAVRLAVHLMRLTGPV